MKWMVAVNKSPDAQMALEFAMNKVNKELDNILVVSIVEDRVYPTVTFNYEFIKQMEIYRNQLRSETKLELLEYGKKLQERGIKFSLHLGVSAHVGEMMILLEEKYRPDYLVVGRRGLSGIKRMFLGSTSKYLLEHSKSNVFIIKQEEAPEEIHTSKKEAIQAEEEERERRIKEEKKLEEQEKFESQLNKNITILAEEEERKLRIEKEKDPIEKEKLLKKATKLSSVVEEEERKIKEQYGPGLF